ncbi:nucleolar GTPase [Capsaspora owczarzaki ATCC 30864]|uniref:Nucleolar GTP-binding protein 2 n=1 Tax=Capsaspora owczarzaki (strain ATCC 30864) TaxID=595528 RepID=A0A0D2WS44_CAPO3|nr:nucleolar GTPase [Capsaspora owczarzaki ATCC 30864]KJE94183.1 nucleolar GTPase [Capsaspora owczarzaki ATCC 30864]|eukprot:XP_004347615.2 nucleolar GTPase [Capsaspora owczarzaki ATCC 30864]
MARPAMSKSTSSTNADRTSTTKDANQRTKATIDRLNLYRTGGKSKRDASGKIVKAAPYQGWVASGTVARIQADRRWFGNTRVIGQDQLQQFREAVVENKKNPFAMIMRENKLPMSLLQDTPAAGANTRVHVLDTEPFANVFGPTAQRKKPSVGADLSDYLNRVSSAGGAYKEEKDLNIIDEGDGFKNAVMDRIFSKGQSRRIWNELYKVIDSSDVVVQVLDARDPLGTRSSYIEEYMRKEKPHKQLILLLNKCDLVPTWVTARWVKHLSRQVPTLAFHASIANPFGKGAFISLLRQFGKLHADKKQISVGFIGYPNVGKSSVINTLKAKKVCKVAPIPGETKVWQYITLMRRIFLVDCPGVVYHSTDTESDIVLKGVVRIENLKDAADHIPEMLSRIKREYVCRTYMIDDWGDHLDFLEQLAQKYGKLLKGGEPDIETVAKMVLNDWLRGKLPFFVPPPSKADMAAGKTNSASAAAATTAAAGAITATAAAGATDGAASFGSADVNSRIEALIAQSRFKPVTRPVVGQDDDEVQPTPANAPLDEDDHTAEDAEGADEKALLRVALSAIGVDASAADEEVSDDDGEDAEDFDPSVRAVDSDPTMLIDEDDDEEEPEDQDDQFEDVDEDSDVEEEEGASSLRERQRSRKIKAKQAKLPRAAPATTSAAVRARKEKVAAKSASASKARVDAAAADAESGDLFDQLVQTVSGGKTAAANDRFAGRKHARAADDDDEDNAAVPVAQELRKKMRTEQGFIVTEEAPAKKSAAAKSFTASPAAAAKKAIVAASPKAAAVFKAASPKAGLVKPVPVKKAAAVRVEEDDDEDVKVAKEPRMTTNKARAGVHYYENANVKNKNKNRKIPKQPHGPSSGRKPAGAPRK